MCTNITLVAIYNVHGDQLHFPRSAADFLMHFAMRNPTGEEAQAVGASLVASSLQRCQISVHAVLESHLRPCKPSALDLTIANTWVRL